MLGFNKKPLIMGILNITPDSFSDGGKDFKIEDAINHAEKLIKSGVDILDIGGESTRPGALPISKEEELKRIIPVIECISMLNCLISIDTYKSSVAKAALEAGANIINDVSGLTMDPNMVEVVQDANCPIVIMHNTGVPATKPENDARHGKEQGIVQEVSAWLKHQTDYAISSGIKKENIIIDPGIGFGKTLEEDFYIIENLKELQFLGYPILIGPSKKSFIKKLFPDSDINEKSKEIIDLCIKNGASIARIHL